MVRVDQAGGVSLYIERDWDRRLLATICGWFGVSDRPVEVTQRLTEAVGCPVGGIGLHWRGFGKPRLRLYAISRARARAGQLRTRRLLELLDRELGHFVPPWIIRLMHLPRRALIVNIEQNERKTMIKFEISDIAWTEVMRNASLRKGKAMGLLSTNPPERLCYLGARVLDRSEIQATFYLPFGYPLTG
ncbi:MAG: hypothetical protein AB1664_20355 [Thermodesulfobacteriota bacterium]